MKKIKIDSESFYDSITSGVAPENDWIIQALMKKMAEETAAERAQNKIKLKAAGAAIVSAALIGSSALGVGIATKKDLPQNNQEIQTQIIEPNNLQVSQKTDYDFTPSQSNPNFEIKSIKGVDYYCCTPECTLELARQSMARIQKLLQSAGATPVGLDSGEFYPEYYNEYLLSGIAMTESSLRVCTTSGEPLVSKDGAIGLMQVLPKTVSTINDWLVDTMGITGLSYTTQDLSNPEKSMDIANLTLIWICKNYCKPNCNNPLYKKMDKEFSLADQKNILIATYEQGPDEMIKHINSGKIAYYITPENSGNYLSKINFWQQHFLSNYGALER